MEVPLGDSDRILVSEEYVRFLVDLANQRMEANWKRTRGFLSGLVENGFVGSSVPENGEHQDRDDDQLERAANGYSTIGMVGGGGDATDCSLSVSPILVAGEHVEKLFLWGHSASLVGDFVFVIGGRADPSKASDAAVVVGSNRYVYGGLNNDTILSSLHVLNNGNLRWQEVLVNGEQPCTHYSHSVVQFHFVVAYGSKYSCLEGTIARELLGIYTGSDVQTFKWKIEKMARRSPHARFSHSMFVYKNFLGVVGGCPVAQHLQELALLDLQFHMGKHVTLDYIWKELLVCTTANVGLMTLLSLVAVQLVMHLKQSSASH